MATYKRRIIYLSDEEWEAVSTKARARGYTISEYVRRVLNAHEPSTSSWNAIKAQKGAPAGPEPVGRPDPRQFNTRPFTPVPKQRG